MDNLTLSCPVLYSFCNSSLHSLIKLLTISFLSPHNLYLLFFSVLLLLILVYPANRMATELLRTMACEICCISHYNLQVLIFRQEAFLWLFSVFLFESGKSLVWDSTCFDTFSHGNLVVSSLDLGSAPWDAKDWKLN